MTIFNRKKHSCLLHFLDVLGLAELSQGVSPQIAFLSVVFFCF